jgi:hypothetical protein
MSIPMGYDAIEPQAGGYGQTKERSAELSMAISLKRIADALDRLPLGSGEQLGIFLQAAERERKRQEDALPKFPASEEDWAKHDRKAEDATKWKRAVMNGWRSDQDARDGDGLAYGVESCE